MVKLVLLNIFSSAFLVEHFTLRCENILCIKQFTDWLTSCFNECTLPATMATFTIICTVVVLLFVSYYRRIDKRKIIALEQKLLLSQMNPHFVFNSLTAIQSYIFRNDPYMAGKYLASFSKLVRLILENSRVEYITIAKEKETIERYLDLQLLRFDNKFEYTIEISQNIDLDHHYIPPMLAQPFIENAIEHGIIHSDSKGHISIRFIIDDNCLFLEVEDNGVGLSQRSEHGVVKREKHQSLATRITRERLRNLRKIYGRSVRMQIVNLSTEASTGQGTLIRFTIPLIIK